MTFSVVHPYAQRGADQSFLQQVKAGGTFVIANTWGAGGRGVAEYHRQRLDEAKAAGGADTSESVLGSSLAVLAATWVAQSNHAAYINDRLANTTTVFHHQLGIAGYNTSPYVDLPGNVGGVVSLVGDSAMEATASFSASMHASIFESTAVQQVHGVSAVSTAKLIDIAASNGDKIFDAKSANFTSVVRPALIWCSSWTSVFLAAVNAGHRLILPTRCNITENTWMGAAYFDLYEGGGNWSFGAIIGGGLAGGFGSTPVTQSQTNTQCLGNTVSRDSLLFVSGLSYNDPIDMVKGSYQPSPEFPSGLPLPQV